MTCHGVKCRAAKVLLPLPETPTSTTSPIEGTLMLSHWPSIRRRTPSWVGWPMRAVEVADAVDVTR